LENKFDSASRNELRGKTPAGNDLISSDVQDLMSYRPHWFIRNGNAIFFFTLILGFALTWFIDYPDVIKGSVRLTAGYPQAAAGSLPYHGEMVVPRTALATIRPGQIVLIQSGKLRGRVGEGSGAPAAGDSIRIKIDLGAGVSAALPADGTTSAEIITANRTLFDRLWESVTARPASPSPSTNP
jgi:hypothetical protein